MIYFEMFLLLALIVCAIGTIFTRHLLASIVVFMAYSSVMAVVWLVLESPDLSITGAAVGAGVDTIVMVVTLERINQLKGTERNEE